MLRSPRALAVERRDAMGVDEDAASLAARDEAQDPRGIVTVGRGEHDVFDASDRRAVSVLQRQASHAERVDEVARHDRNLPAEAR